KDVGESGNGERWNGRRGYAQTFAAEDANQSKYARASHAGDAAREQRRPIREHEFDRGPVQAPADGGDGEKGEPGQVRFRLCGHRGNEMALPRGVEPLFSG